MKSRAPSILDRSDGVLDRMKRASDIVEDRLDRAASALSQAGVPYAVIGGLAVAAWVGSIDQSRVRMTRDVDMLLNRSDLDRARAALEAVGFTYRRAAGIDLFLDTPNAKAGDAVHVFLANEAVRPGDEISNPPLERMQTLGGVSYVPVEELVKTKLYVWRRKDQMHLVDLIGVGLVDEGWVSRFPEPLSSRLRELLNDPREQPLFEDA